MTQHDTREFESREDLELWLRHNHATAPELWVRMFKKGSGRPSVDWDDCVMAVLAWGWIDGKRMSLDEVSFIQRMTPRRARSTWSQRNCERVERLIAEGRMQPSGMVHVERARADGRWERAYAGSADMVLPDELTRALEATPGAREAFDKLSRSQAFAIYFGVQTAKRAETRAKRIAKALEELMRRGADGG